MIIRKAFKYKLKTTDEIEQQCLSMSGCCRFLWNKALAMNLYRLENKQPILWYNELAFWLTLWKKSEEMSFLKSCDSQALQQTLKNLDRAFKDAFDKHQPNKRIPKFKRKGQHDSFRYPQRFKVEGNRLYLPKVGWLGFFKSRELEGKLKNATVSKHADGWYVSLQVEQEIEAPNHSSKTMVGIDRGIKQLAYLSNGQSYAPIHSYKKYQAQLAKAQRKLKRKTKFSENWKKQQKRISKIQYKIAQCRQDRLHWISNRISQNHAMVVLEDLKVSNMSKSAKGNLDNPGKNVKAKSGLNRSILDQGWSMFASMLEYKQHWRGGEVIYVDPKYTSRTCPECQHEEAANRRTQSEFECQSCGYKNNADHVGAINILARGHRVLACGAEPLGAAVKQEPLAA